MLMKTLIFDVDRSLASIGSYESIRKLLGISPLKINHGVSDVRGYLNRLLVAEIVRTKHEIFGEQEETVLSLNETARELNLGVLVVDTLSALGLQERGEIRKKNAPKKNNIPQKPYPSMKLQDWGTYGDTMNDFVYSIGNIPAAVIMNAHIDRDSTATDLGIVEYPALKGSAKNEIQKWFDVILYTAIDREKGRDGEPVLRFVWHTKPFEGRNAKDRLGALPTIMDQDFAYVIEAYRAHGIFHPKILVLGESGTGKSYALKSLSKLNKEVADESTK
jgi:hypothetical protein